MSETDDLRDELAVALHAHRLRRVAGGAECGCGGWNRLGPDAAYAHVEHQAEAASAAAREWMVARALAVAASVPGLIRQGE